MNNNSNSKVFKITKNVIKYVILAFVAYQVIFDVFYTKLLPSVKNLSPNEALNQLVMSITSLNADPSDVEGWLGWGLGLIALLTLITILFRKAFCKNICPFGSLQDLCGKLGDWFFLKVLKVDHTPEMPKWLHELLSYLKYLVLLVYILFAAISGYSLIYFVFDNVLITSPTAANLGQPFMTLDPWIAFRHLREWESLTTAYYFVLGAMVFCLVGSFLFKRFYCKYMCPTGAYVNIISFFSLLRKKNETVEENVENQLVEEIATAEDGTENAVEIETIEGTDAIESAEIIENTETIDATESIESAETIDAIEDTQSDDGTLCDCGGIELVVLSKEEIEETSCTSDMCANCSCKCSHGSRGNDEFDDEDEYFFGEKVNPLIPLILSVVVFIAGVIGLQFKDVNAVSLGDVNIISVACESAMSLQEMIDYYEDNNLTKERLYSDFKLPENMSPKTSGYELAMYFNTRSFAEVVGILGAKPEDMAMSLGLPKDYDVNRTLGETLDELPVNEAVNVYSYLIPYAHDFNIIDGNYRISSHIKIDEKFKNVKDQINLHLQKEAKEEVREAALRDDLDESRHHH